MYQHRSLLDKIENAIFDWKKEMMMYYNYEEYEVEVTHTTCAYHKRNPLTPYAGCTCSGSYSLVPKRAAQSTSSEETSP